MKRRNFFATLFGGIAAFSLPKAKASGPQWEGTWTGVEVLEISNTGIHCKLFSISDRQMLIRHNARIHQQYDDLLKKTSVDAARLTT